MKEDEKLIELMKLHNDNRIDYNERIWATINFTQAIFSIVIIATITGFSTLYQDYSNCITYGKNVCIAPLVGLQLLFMGLLIFGIIVVCFCKKNVRREFEHLLYEEGQSIRIAKYLHLDKTIPANKKVCNEEDKLLEKKWLPFSKDLEKERNDQEDLEKWVNAKKKLREGFFVKINRFLNIEILVAIILIIIFGLIMIFTKHPRIFRFIPIPFWWKFHHHGYHFFL